ncbi:polysaccharide deacetylase family protein [Vallitalea guaymasensis]|uniref:polysaccharide deacetylase family protein n=1 Tax=Vallitalea guaymasensis TaxID=1185412 RepID=UPI0023545E86|nr:polysaccharide deacetylase family protein [Vallitalea guaymasensis]
MKRLLAVILVLSLLSFGSYSLGANNNINNVIVLMYHHILPKKDMVGPWKNNSAVLALEDFQKQMMYLYDNGYTILTLKDFKDYIYENKPIPSNSVLITFDDGYKSNFEYAYPILKKYNFKATIFLISSQIQNYYEKFDSKKLQFCSVVELETCSDVFTYGDHTYNLHRKDGETNLPYMKFKSYEDIKNDITLSESILSKYIDIDTKALAYPYGAYTDTSQQILKEKDYKLAFLTAKGKVTKVTNPYYIRRYGISDNENFYSLF